MLFYRFLFVFQNEKNQIMTSNVWLRLVWHDYQLQWDEADYGGISVLRLPPDKVWKPDIVLFNKCVALLLSMEIKISTRFRDIVGAKR